MLLLPVIGFTPTFAQGTVGAAGSEMPQAQNIRVGGQIAQGAAGIVEPPVKSIPAYSAAMPEINADQQAAFDRMEARRERAYRALDARLEPNPDHPVAGPNYYI